MFFCMYITADGDLPGTAQGEVWSLGLATGEKVPSLDCSPSSLSLRSETGGMDV